MTTAAEGTTKTARRAVKAVVETLVSAEPEPVLVKVEELIDEPAGRSYTKFIIAAGALAVGAAGLTYAIRKYRAKKSEQEIEEQAELHV